MIDIFCGLFLLATAALNWFGLLHCIHWLSRRSCGPDGKRWWFWLATITFSIIAMGLVMYHFLFGLSRIAFALLTWGV